MTKQEAQKKKYCKDCNFYQNSRCVDGDLPSIQYRPGTKSGECPLTEIEAKTLGSWNENTRKI